MTELRNIQADLSRFRLRVLIIAIVVVIAFGLVAARLVWLQVLRHDDLAEQAESNRTAVVPIVPNRGQILDRVGAFALATAPQRATIGINQHLTFARGTAFGAVGHDDDGAFQPL